jgi:hypothetical protein
MKSSQKEQCYCCEKIATTKDHIPPKCFFPEKKHLGNDSSDYRSNLITVPACLEHNNSRSRDDEYTAAMIIMNSESGLAFDMFKAKWVRTLLRREAVLGKRIFSTARSARVISRKNGILIPYETLAISYEIERIDRVIESIARGIYYIESGYSEKWIESCIIKSPKFLKENLSYPKDCYETDRLNKAFIYGEKFEELELNKKGTQIDIFYYQFFKFQDKNAIIKMVFYGDFTFMAILKERKTIPKSLILSV